MTTVKTRRPLKFSMTSWQAITGSLSSKSTLATVSHWSPRSRSFGTDTSWLRMFVSGLLEVCFLLLLTLRVPVTNVLDLLNPILSSVTWCLRSYFVKSASWQIFIAVLLLRTVKKKIFISNAMEIMQHIYSTFCILCLTNLIFLRDFCLILQRCCFQSK